MSFMRTGGLQRKGLFFQHFHTFLHTFSISRYFPMLKKFLKNGLSGCKKIANTKSSKTLLKVYIVSVFPGHTGAINYLCS